MPLSDFSQRSRLDKNGIGYYLASCKFCCSIKNRAWQSSNKEKIKDYNAKYHSLRYLNESAKFKIRARLRKLHIKQACPKWLSKEQHKEIQSLYNIAKATKQSVDHIVPLQGKVVCGLHVPWNLQVMPLLDNLSKGNKCL